METVRQGEEMAVTQRYFCHRHFKQIDLQQIICHGFPQGRHFMDRKNGSYTSQSIVQIWQQSAQIYAPFIQEETNKLWTCLRQTAQSMTGTQRLLHIKCYYRMTELLNFRLGAELKSCIS